MILHINLRPDGNGTVFTGTPEELKKRFSDFKKSVERSGPRPNFHSTYEVQVWKAGSKYRMMNDRFDSNWTCCKVEKTGLKYNGNCYQTFGACLNRLVKLMEGER